MKIVVREGLPLTQGQQKILTHMFKNIEYLVEPKNGWSVIETREIAYNLKSKKENVVLASDNMYLAKALGFHLCDAIEDGFENWIVYFLHQENKNDDNSWFLL